MQILTKKQVKYCRLAIQKSTVLDYCLGIQFQDKLFISDEFFARDRQQQAIDYCQNKYLADKGKKSYILIANVAGLTVWQSDKAARIVGQNSPEDFISNLDLDSFIIQTEIAEIFQGNRHYNFQIVPLVESLRISLEEIMNLEQQVRNGYWLKSVASIEPYIAHDYT